MRVTLRSEEFDVLSSSDVHSDAETIEFRRDADDPRPAIAVTQVGDYGSRDVRVLVTRDEPWETVRAALAYAKSRHGVDGQ